jgi:E3 ubiquitin-protein ligase FANCL
LQEFWDEIEYLDQHTWVIDPEVPSRADTRRRILLDKSCSLQIEVNPMHPKTLPTCLLFLGHEKLCTQYRDHFDKYSYQWYDLKGNSCYLKLSWWRYCGRNERLTLKDNLEAMIGNPFPKKEILLSKDEEWDLLCSICYCRQIIGELMPEKACESIKCSRIFHRTCLTEVSIS